MATPINRVYDLLSHMKIRELKQACVVRNMPFDEVGECSMLDLQSFLLKRWDAPTDKTLLNDYDNWLETELRELGCEDLIHPLLRIGYFGEDADGNEIRKQLKNISFSNVKSKKEIAQFKPKKGSKKSLVYEVLRKDPSTTTEELIEIVTQAYPDVSIGSIKSWASRARKSIKYSEEYE
jgi:hypothetical protein